ncbi:hypothetical protein HDU98_002180 [Podochytrium sp. JEL0797]|nr:hypothetical protein HDU98_002180 [Podochytrium sp. JEL0797]
MNIGYYGRWQLFLSGRVALPEQAINTTFNHYALTAAEFELPLWTNTSIKISACLNSYESMNLTTFFQNQFNTPQGVDWLSRQSDPMLLQVVGQVCSSSFDIHWNPIGVAYMFNVYESIQFFHDMQSLVGPLNDTVRNAIDECATMKEYLGVYQTQFWYYLAFGVLVVVVLCGFVAFVVRFEIQAAKKWMTPFNISLFAGGLAVLGYDLTQLMLCTLILQRVNRYEILEWGTGDKLETISNCIAQVFQAMWGITYLNFSWARSQGQIKVLFINGFDHIQRLFLVVPPLLLSIPPIIAILQSVMVGLINELVLCYMFFQGIALLALLAFDLLLLFCFVQFLTRTRINGVTEPKFLIISKYGTMASICCLGVFGASAANLIVNTPFENTNFINLGLDYHVIGGMTMTCAFFMNACFVTLCGMKVTLHFEHVHDSTQGVSGKSTGTKKNTEKISTR